jgi:hypothetical protein
MATYDYENTQTGEIVERVYLPGEVAPEVDGDWVRLFPAPRIVTADTRGFRYIPTEKELRANGSSVIEPGVERDIERAKRYKREQADKDLHTAIEKTVEPIYI